MVRKAKEREDGTVRADDLHRGEECEILGMPGTYVLRDRVGNRLIFTPKGQSEPSFQVMEAARVRRT